ncbi:hypothetical protein CTAYLR_004916 [Chrysophaeum taylorii]|uniref:Cleavage and polyadenylation specificity factor n=1 Tax=Chrysophaeum taylorii TaxID=2483200 RepID=A0AAD7UNT1_9STRA|nr:hypothetical protein CTAYLR_004916 [Chrysophaeum taylorii]
MSAAGGGGGDTTTTTTATATATTVEDVMQITPLGAGQEVGRSCHLLSFRGYTILLDCGIHPGRSGLDALPFLDTVELSSVDLLLVSHFHIDHAAGVPYLTEKTDFRGRIFMTHPTKAVMRVLLSDYIRLLPEAAASSSQSQSQSQSDRLLYDESDLESCCDKIELVDFHQVVEHEGVRFWCYTAGHVLGAAMFMIEIGGVRVLYTGDYSLEEDRHLVPAEVPKTSPDVLVMESTYGTQKHEARDVREALFTSTVERVVQRGGRCLIPVFALGRAQELLLILDEYWAEREDLRRVPVYYASKLATRALRVYQTYVNMMNRHVQNQMDVMNPFRFTYVRNMVDDVDDSGPCVVLASPGMLQSGVSRHLFERWCQDPKNGVIIAGYSVEGTLAKKLMSEPEEVQALDGRALQRKCAVVSISFSAHTDYKQNSEFVEATSPANIVLVHGEKNEMLRFKNQLGQQATKWSRRPTISAPELGQPVLMRFRRDRTVAVSVPDNNKKRRRLSGVLVSKNLRGALYADDELAESSSLSVATLEQRLRVRLAPAAAAALPAALQNTFLDVVLQHDKDDDATLVVCGCVKVKVVDDRLELVWRASPFADLVADAAACCALQARAFPQTNIAAPCCDSSSADVVAPVVSLVRTALVEQFGDDNVNPPDEKKTTEKQKKEEKKKNDDGDTNVEEEEEEVPRRRTELLKLQVAHDEARAVCTLFQHEDDLPAYRFSVDVASEDDALRQRLLKLLNRVLRASTPLETYYPQKKTKTPPRAGPFLFPS